MNRGKWYLVYTEFDDMENRVSSALIQEKILLSAIDEGGANEEANKIWGQKRTHKGWDGGLYPQSPCVVYEFSLQ